MRQGNTKQSGGPADGVTARDEIARVLIDSLSNEAANRKTLELEATHGTEQEDLTADFAVLQANEPGSFDGVLDSHTVPVSQEPQLFQDDLARIASAGR